MSTGDIDVEIPIQVVIKEFRPESQGLVGRLDKPGFVGSIEEETISLTPVERIGLFSVVGHEIVQMAVSIDISAVNAHAGFAAGVGVESDSGLESSILKAALANVAPEKIRHRIIGDQEVDIAIPIVVGRKNPQPLRHDPPGPGHSRGFRDVLELSTAPVDEERIRSPIVFVRMAIGRQPP